MPIQPVVIVGGGFAGVYTAKELLARKIPVLLISETNHFTFTPLLHEVATGSLSSHDASFAYETFFRSPLFRFVRGRVTGIDPDARQVQIGEDLMAYRYLVLAVGSTTNLYTIKGTEHAFVLKSIEDAIVLKKAILERAQDFNRHIAISVVGGGPTGLELVFEIDQMLKALQRKNTTVDYSLRLIHAGETFCRGGGDRIQQYIDQALKKAGIVVACGAMAQTITKDSVETSVGTFHSDITVLCAGVRPRTDFLKEVFSLDAQGHLQVDASLRVIEDAFVFALGDMITLGETPVPKLAQTAVAQASVVAKNIQQLLQMRDPTLRTYQPKVKGMLFSLGFVDGVGTIGPVMVKGLLAWYLWRTVYLFKTPGLLNKLRVAFSWTMDLFQGRNLTEL